MREIRRLVMDRDHEVGARHVDTKRLGAVLSVAWEKSHNQFTDTLLLPGVGPRTVQTLALVAEVIYGAPHRFDDPARFSFALGGKDGSPFPVPLTTYDESIAYLRTALDRSRAPGSDKLESLRTLTRFTQFVEQRYSRDVDIEYVKRREHAMSASYGGRTVFDRPAHANAPRTSSATQQMSLFDAQPDQ